jgi:glycosyltransferase involved in cell wall biosynthesis
VSRNGDRRPRVLFVGRTRYALPLPSWLAKKWEALERQLDLRVIAAAPSRDAVLEDGPFRLISPLRIRPLDGILWYLRAPLAVRRQIREFRPDAIVAESPYTGAASLLGRALAGGPRPRVVVEVHGDWRTATRLYGSPKRVVLAPLADWVSGMAVRRGDAVRAVSGFTEQLAEDVRGVPATATFAAYMPLAAFTEKPPQPLPETPTILFIGMLEAYKNVDGLAAAWEEVARRVPDARLVLVGQGSRAHVAERLVAAYPERVDWHPVLPPERVAEELDRATLLALPSFNEGLGRVLIEALARGRGIVASRGGGILDVVRDDVEGLLVEQGNTEALADALTRVLTDRPLAERLASAAHERYGEWHTTPAQYAARMRDLVDLTVRGGPGERPRVLLVAAAAPDDATVRALREEVELSVLPARRHATLPFRVRGHARRFRPDVIVAESPYLGWLVLAGLVLRRSRPSLVVETHGDWREDFRVGGSRLRTLLAPLADRAARHALRRADALRAVSPFTASLAERAAGVPPVESFPGYIDLAAFTERAPQPLPETPTALFVGMLERSKDVATLVRAWPLVVDRIPEARLVVVGRGALADLVAKLRDDLPGSVEHVEELAPSGVAAAMDASTCLVLPSRSEGLGRVVIESFARARPVVASRVGGIPDLVRPDETGLLVESGDAEELAGALVSLLGDRERAARLGEGGLAVVRELRWSPDDYAARVRTLVDRTLAATAR